MEGKASTRTRTRMMPITMVKEEDKENRHCHRSHHNPQGPGRILQNFICPREGHVLFGLKADLRFSSPLLFTPLRVGAPPTPQVFWFSPCFFIVSFQKPLNLHMFGHKVGPKYRCLQCFQCSNMPNPLNTSLFASFLSVFPLPETSHNDPKFHLHTFWTSYTQKSSQKHKNTNRIRARCKTAFSPQLKLI